MHDDEPKNNYTKMPLNVYFLAFCSVIYQNLLHRRVYIVVILETTFHQFCEKPLHITFKGFAHAAGFAAAR